MVGAFGSVWTTTGESPGGQRLVRIDPDLSTTSIEVVGHSLDLGGGCDSCRGAPITAGGGDMWVPLGEDGVAMFDPDTNQVTVIAGDVIGHWVSDVAVDGDVIYVSSRDRVTSIVDGQVVATVSPRTIEYLGRVDGVFGVLLEDASFEILRADEPMVVERRRTDIDGFASPVADIDGEAWIEPYYFTAGDPQNPTKTYDLRRIRLLPTSDEG